MEVAPIHLSLDDIIVRAGHKILIEINNYISQIVGDPQGILDQQLMPYPIHLLSNFYFYND
jgi:hypothetical protein